MEATATATATAMVMVMVMDWGWGCCRWLMECLQLCSHFRLVLILQAKS